MTTQTTPQKRSVKLSPEEFKALKGLRKEYDTETDMALAIGIKRETLNRVWIVRSGSPVTVGAIRMAIAAQETKQSA